MNFTTRFRPTPKSGGGTFFLFSLLPFRPAMINYSAIRERLEIGRGDNVHRLKND